MVIEVHKKVVDLKDFYNKLKELGFRFSYKISGYETDIIYVIHVR